MNYITSPKFNIKIIQEHEEGDPIREHHKKRINKKWLKRYGVYGPQKLAKNQILIFDRIIFMSRQSFNAIKNKLNRKVKKQE